MYLDCAVLVSSLSFLKWTDFPVVTLNIPGKTCPPPPQYSCLSLCHVLSLSPSSSLAFYRLFSRHRFVPVPVLYVKFSSSLSHLSCPCPFTVLSLMVSFYYSYVRKRTGPCFIVFMSVCPSQLGGTITLQRSSDLCVPRNQTERPQS
jgi:hypothetical protein